MSIPTIDTSFYDLKIGDLIYFNNKILGKIVSTDGYILVVIDFNDDTANHNVSITNYLSRLDLSKECLVMLDKTGNSPLTEFAIGVFCYAEKVYGLRKQDPISLFCISALKGDAQAVDLITDTLRL